MRRFLAVVVASVATLGLAPAVAAAAPAVPAAGASGPTVRCEFIPTPDNPAAKPVRPPSPKAPARGTPTAVFATNYGPVVMELDRANAPCAVHNFTHLVRNLFYNHTRCWRLTDSARLGVLQCGDIVSVEVGGPGYRFADELTGAETYPRGTVAMGNQGPDTNGSQFFIVYGDSPLPAAYTVFGSVDDDAVAAIEKVAKKGTDDANGQGDGHPKEDVTITSVTVG